MDQRETLLKPRPKLFLCTTCRQYKELSSFMDQQFQMVTTKCSACRMDTTRMLIHPLFLFVESDIFSMSQRDFERWDSRRRRLASRKRASDISSLIPHSQWVVMSDASASNLSGVVVAKYIYHRDEKRLKK